MSTDPAKHAPRGLAMALVLVLAVSIGAAIYAGINTRVADRAQLESGIAESAIPSVSVVHPKKGAAAEEIQLPGNVMPFVDAAIYARTSGYLKKWHFDIGSRVESGQLLAEIETPEVDQQLEQARADLQRAEADLVLAKVKAERWTRLLVDKAVSREEKDEADSDFVAKKAMVNSSQASVRRLEQMQSFEKVAAPFAGVVTARNVDTGDLISAGSGAQPREMFHLAALDRVRVYVAVPAVYAEAARMDNEATLTLDQFPGRTFTGKVVRNANAIDSATRTLKVEVDVDNADGSLMSGAYAMVHLKVGRARPGDSPAVTIPANTLLFRAEGTQVALLREGRAELVSVKIGRDFGRTLEILSGLKPADTLILDPSDSLVSGMRLRASPASAELAEKKALGVAK